MKLKPYQIEDNDIVLAENEKQAVDVYKAKVGGFDESDEFEVTDLSECLDMKFHDEDGNAISTLGEWIKDMTDPQYVVGWE